MLCAASVPASPVLRLSTSQALSTTVADQGPGDEDLAEGVVEFSGPLDAWTINVTTGTGSVILGAPRLELSSLNISSFGTDAFPSGGGSITIELSEQNMTLGAFPQLISFLGSIGGITDGIVAWRMYVDDGNALFAQSQLIGMGNASMTTLDDQFSSVRSVTDTFSMTLLVEVMHGDGIRSTNLEFAGLVPEPDTLLLLGIGLMALAYARRRITI